jgi:hypothetical protein
MTKFAVIQFQSHKSNDREMFEKKYKASELKKQFKCEKVLELKNYQSKKTKEAEFTKIADYKLNELLRTLTSTDFDDLSENRSYVGENTRVFIFSEDACSSAFAFDLLKDDVVVKVFQLTDQNVRKFLEYIDVIQSSDEKISSLTEAKDQCESLSYIESDLNLSLLQSDAIETIESEISDVEDSVEKSKEWLDEIFENQWD